ncbi:hypothetical protein KY329_01085 [Candidatus Woesearchaeota archaeon]|nr:hypothetical protein [Candidatus Woesearchaeota archaeon]
MKSKVHPALWLVFAAFAVVFGLALVAQGSMTGQFFLPSVKVDNGTVLSAIAAVLSIGVLLVAGLQKPK